jgi:hypothetical protein
LESVLIFRTFLLDEKCLVKSRSAARSTPSAYKDASVRILRKASGVAAGMSPRTNGLAQAILETVTCEQLLWREHSYSGTNMDVKFLSFAWPNLDWALLEDFVLFQVSTRNLRARPMIM